jgi:hypothetical protein
MATARNEKDSLNKKERNELGKGTDEILIARGESVPTATRHFPVLPKAQRNG